MALYSFAQLFVDNTSYRFNYFSLGSFTYLPHSKLQIQAAVQVVGSRRELGEALCRSLRDENKFYAVIRGPASLLGIPKPLQDPGNFRNQ